MQVRSFLDVEARSVSWLWPWRLAAAGEVLTQRKAPTGGRPSTAASGEMAAAIIAG
jgi:hypothetical protein